MGTVAADGSFSVQVSPGEHQIAFSREGYTPAYIRRDFSAGATVTLGRAEAQLTAVATPKAPPKAPPKALTVEISRPDPAAVELADWQRISRNPTIGDIQEFLQKHPSGSNAQEAQRTLERLEWTATNKSSKTALQAFLTKHPSEPCAASCCRIGSPRPGSHCRIAKTTGGRADPLRAGTGACRLAELRRGLCAKGPKPDLRIVAFPAREQPPSVPGGVPRFSIAQVGASPAGRSRSERGERAGYVFTVGRGR